MPKISKNLLSAFNVIAFIFIILFQLQCGPKEAMKITTRVVFIIGKVELNRPGAGNISPEVGDILYENDSVKTSDKSSLIFQTEDKCITRIDQNSDVVLSKLFSNKEGIFLLQKGEIESKVSTLRKGEVYSVKTPTIVASVRGTEFSVSTESNKEQVAVKKGAVFVEGINELVKNQIKETLVENGQTAVVTSTGEISGQEKRKIELRPISSVEMLKIEKVGATALVPDLDNIKSEDLKKIQPDMIRGAEELDKKIEMQKSSNDSDKAAKIEKLIQKKTKTIEEIKEVFERIDEVALYSGEIIKGAILTRGAKYEILTTSGILNIDNDKVRSVKIIK